MPRRAPRACSEPLCPALVTGRLAKCPKHERQRRRRHDDRRPSFAARGYGPQWQGIRQIVLAREPCCRICRDEFGRVTAANVVDHVIPKPRGVEDYDLANLQPLCTPCHARKCAQELNAMRRRR